MKARFADLRLLPRSEVLRRKDLITDFGKPLFSFMMAEGHEILLQELRSRDAMLVPDLMVASLRYGGMSSTRTDLCADEAGNRREILD